MSPEDSVVNGILPPTLPATTDDAITVTLKLGFNYLWVDHFCIDQTDQAEVKRQIGMVDLIYLNAKLTIVAAARGSVMEVVADSPPNVNSSVALRSKWLSTTQQPV